MTQVAVSKKCAHRKPSKGLGLWTLLGLARQRRSLAKLDDRALEDIGVSRAEADTEAARPFWDAPVNWHKRLY
ncbi:DUF1127 domain-containing protein [Ruegeria arenilitoris]|uniref:DUF1127 domain-containing protein n=1 Tax=Ruegeria arenilitoris TaxID=1173585 RepID=UPI001480CB49|nr:DUF1127 domain-containing protein [Ruegeria arenilitoris]